MRSGIKGGLNIDDEEVRKPDQYQKLDADRKKGNLEKDLDAMLFGGMAPAVRKPRAPKPETPEPPKVTPPPPAPTKPVVVPSPTNANNTSKIVVKPEPPKPIRIETVNTSTVEIKPQPVKPANLTGSKKINNYVEPRPQTPPRKETPQPIRYDEPEFSDRFYPYSNKIAFNRPTYVRKLKKVAEDFNFAQENASLHFVYDTIRPAQTDRARQQKYNANNFSDFVFPANPSSLGPDHKDTPSAWKKPNEFAKSTSFGKYIDPNDLRPGTLSSPHFLSTLSGLSELQFNIKRLIQNQKVNNNGFYLVRLFINSVWRYIPVDSLLPFIDNENAGVLSNADSEFELSTALIEKAYAKSFGGYNVFSTLQPRQYYLRDLTGAPVTKYSIENYDLSNIVKKAIAAGKVILAVPNERLASLGLNPNYSYNVINYTAKGTLQLRNSWGTLQERSKVPSKPEGTFELTTAQSRDALSHILIAHLNPAYYTTTIQSRHKYGFYSSYNFKVTEDTHGYLTVSQWDQRLFPSASGYEYSPFHVVLYKVQSKQNSTFVNTAYSAKSRNLDLEVNLSPGNYVVFCAANWLQKEHSYNLTFYGSQRVQFERVYTGGVPQLISQGFQTINVQKGRKTDVGKAVSQYFLYHPESNLVLLTVENTSDRESTTTADLTRVKLDHLALLTSHSNEENYSNKSGAEIEEYKGIALTDRRWSILLKPRERHTWIFAAQQPYHPQNPKKWGFN